MLHLPHQAQPTLVGFADIRPQPIDDWQQYRLEGQQYLHVAQSAFLSEKKAFTTEILYNLIAMAIEKLVMAALMEIGCLPCNHTMHDLVAALEQWLPEAIKGLEGQVSNLDRYQDICDPYAWSIRIPARDEIKIMLALARNLEQRLVT